MNQRNDIPGAVIMGGSFACLGAARNLSEHGVRVCIISSATDVARFSRSTNLFINCSLEMQDNELLHYLVNLAEKHQIRGWVLFPTSDEHLRIVAQYRSILEKHYVLTTPPWPETVRFLYDKRLTCVLAKEAGISMPRRYEPENADRLAAPDLDFPVVLKPAVPSRFLRSTNRKAYRANNKNELQSLYERMSRVIDPREVIIQDFLPNASKNLFSFAGYFKNGEPFAGLSAKRTRQFPRDFGRTSSFVEVVEVPELRDLSSRLLRAINFTGLAELEFMWNEKKSRFDLLEVNARLWAWHSLAVAAGIDLPYIAFSDALGRNPTAGVVRPGVKWIRFRTDVRAAVQEILSGTLSIRKYFTSFHGSITWSVFSISDPLPFIAGPFLILFEYLNRLIFKRVRSIKFGGRGHLTKNVPPDM